MIQAISAVVALLVGLVTWGFTSIVSKGVYPFGSAGALDEVVFYAPIIGLVLPAAVRSFASQSPAGGVWLIALAPVAGVLNFIPFTFFYVVSRLILSSSIAEVVSACLAAGIWAVAFYMQWRARGPETSSNVPEKPVKLLRRPGRS